MPMILKRASARMILVSNADRILGSLEKGEDKEFRADANLLKSCPWLWEKAIYGKTVPSAMKNFRATVFILGH